jgi:diacylglycerol kinase family enzyme
VAATHLLVGNPTAQSGKNADRIDAALGLLTRAGLEAELCPTEPGGATVGAVKGALDSGRFEVVIAMGGDGTFREVAAALYTSARRDHTALAMLPTGTANDQGKSFGLEAAPSALERNVEVIRAGHETRLDVGAYHAPASGPADYFFDSAGWGLMARVLARRNRDRKVIEKLGVGALYRDHAVYAGALLTTFLESYVVLDKFRVIARLDGKVHAFDGVSDLLVKNTRVYAGAWVFDRTSRHDDGAFELVPFRGKRDWTSKAIVDLDGNPLTEELLNQVGIEHSHPIRASKIELEFDVPKSAPPLAAQVDGEEWPAHPTVKIEVVARAIRLIVPA